MADQINKTPEQRRIISGRMLLLCLSGLLINTIFAHMARMMALPLYLDNIGSALAAALGGYIPGIIVGFPDQPDQRDLGLYLHLLRLSDNSDCRGVRLVCRKEMLQFPKALAASGGHRGFRPDRRRSGLRTDLVPLRVLICLRYLRTVGPPPFLRGNYE